MSEQRSHPEIEAPGWLAWLLAEPGGREWLDRLPGLVAGCAYHWGLRLGTPFRGEVSYVAPAITASGSEVVLKVNFPSEESEHEAVALRHWGGSGAVKLLEEDVPRRALLLERCVPGHMLWDEPEQDATSAMVDVFGRLWDKPAPDEPFQELAAAASVWSDHLAAAYDRAGCPFERSLLNEALDFMSSAKPRSSDDVVLHQDLHGGNVLRRGDEWVAIDPKPLSGERAFDLASYVRDRRERMNDKGAAAVVRTRLQRLCSAFGIDQHRARGWSLAHALAWSFDGEGNFYPDLVEAARLIADY